LSCSEFAKEEDQTRERNTKIGNIDNCILCRERAPMYEYLNDGLGITNKRRFSVSIFGTFMEFYKDPPRNVKHGSGLF